MKVATQIENGHLTGALAGQLLQGWRKRRRISQLELALTAGVSAKHVSFMETGRSKPSRDMLLHLAQHLQISPREQNELLLAAGYAPAFRETPFNHQSLEDARRVVELTLQSFEPYPAIAIDRYWNAVLFNRAVEPVLSMLSPALRTPPINVLRLSLHPDGIAPRIVNFEEWRGHLLMRLRHQIAITGDSKLVALLEEVSAYPHAENHQLSPPSQIAIPLELQTPTGTLRFYTTTMVFGSPVDITLTELAIETFMPADAETFNIMQRQGSQHN